MEQCPSSSRILVPALVSLMGLLAGACAQPRTAPSACEGVSLETPPCTVGCDTPQGSPFGIHDPTVPYPDGVADLAAIGARWVRYAGVHGITWDAIETTPGVRSWSRTDRVYGDAAAQGMAISSVVLAYNRNDGTFGYIPSNMDWYLDFLRAAVERYDGDGTDDAPGSPVVAVFEIDNEPDRSLLLDGTSSCDGTGFCDTPENYALLLKDSYQAIKEVNPSALVAFAGLAGPRGIDFLRRALVELERIADNPGDRYFDLASFHWSGQFKGDYRTEIFPAATYTLEDTLTSLRALLADHGYADLPVWITEMSFNDGQPSDLPWLQLPRTELDQANELFRRFVYPASLGVERVFWVTLTEWHNFGGVNGGYFDYVGVINNPLNDGQTSKKLAYFTYRFLADNLAGGDWSGIETLQQTDGTHLFRLRRNAGADVVYVAWADGIGPGDPPRQLTLPLEGASCAVVTQAIPAVDWGAQVDPAAYDLSFSRQAVPVEGGVATVELGARPVYVRAVR